MQWIPLVLLAVPFLLLALFAGPAIQTILMGPVNIWNATKSAPPAVDLAGYYQLTDKDRKVLSQRGVSFSNQSGFKLAADGSLTVVDLPSFDGFGNEANCHYNGTGHWSLDDSGMEIHLVPDIEASIPAPPGALSSCGRDSLGLFAVLGHSVPYRFWYWTDDPDTWNGLTYIRR